MLAARRRCPASAGSGGHRNRSGSSRLTMPPRRAGDNGDLVRDRKRQLCAPDRPGSFMAFVQYFRRTPHRSIARRPEDAVDRTRPLYGILGELLQRSSRAIRQLRSDNRVDARSRPSPPYSSVSEPMPAGAAATAVVVLAFGAASATGSTRRTPFSSGPADAAAVLVDATADGHRPSGSGYSQWDRAYRR